MARKTTKIALDAIIRFEEAIAHFEEVLRVKQLPLENQARHIREKSIEFYEGWLSGVQMMTEFILHEQRCYHGFGYVDSNLKSLDWQGVYEHITQHPEYRKYRVHYYRHF